MATATYINHSGFFLELPHICLLFDYYNGTLPEPKDKPLVIFASHSHPDHFSPDIFPYGQRWKQVHFVLSRDIRPRKVPEAALADTTFVRRRETHDLAIGGVPLHIVTLTSTDIGTAFMVSCDGKQLYHAGDLNWWTWEESKEYDNNMTANFKREMETLRGLTFDAAFVPLDPRQQHMAFNGLDYAARTAHFKRIYPMHCWGDYDIINRLMADPCSLPYRDAICPITQEGQTDEF